MAIDPEKRAKYLQFIESIRPEAKEMVHELMDDKIKTTKDNYGKLMALLSGKTFPSKLAAQLFLAAMVKEGYPSDTAKIVNDMIFGEQQVSTNETGIHINDAIEGKWNSKLADFYKDAYKQIETVLIKVMDNLPVQTGNEKMKIINSVLSDIYASSALFKRNATAKNEEITLDTGLEDDEKFAIANEINEELDEHIQKIMDKMPVENEREKIEIIRLALNHLLDNSSSLDISLLKNKYSSQLRNPYVNHNDAKQRKVDKLFGDTSKK